MTVVLEGDLVLARGVLQIFFTASAGQLPGVFSGKVDLTALPDVDDIVKISLKTKYTAIGSLIDAEDNDTGQQVDKIFRITPTEEPYGYELTIELLSTSPSANATLAFLISRTPLPV